MLWKIYVWIFAVINVLSFISFGYGTSFNQLFGLLTLILGAGLNISAYSYAYRKPVFSKAVLNLLFKANLALIGLFLIFEFIAFLQEIIGAGIALPTSGLVSILAGFPSFPALYATYRLASQKSPKKGKSRKK